MQLRLVSPPPYTGMIADALASTLTGKTAADALMNYRVIVYVKLRRISPSPHLGMNADAHVITLACATSDAPITYSNRVIVIRKYVQLRPASPWPYAVIMLTRLPSTFA